MVNSPGRKPPVACIKALKDWCVTWTASFLMSRASAAFSISISSSFLKWFRYFSNNSTALNFSVFAINFCFLDFFSQVLQTPSVQGWAMGWLSWFEPSPAHSHQGCARYHKYKNVTTYNRTILLLGNWIQYNRTIVVITVVQFIKKVQIIWAVLAQKYNFWYEF